MEKAILLSELRALSATVPSFTGYSPTSRPHVEWLAKAHALVQRWNPSEAIGVQLASDMMPADLLRDSNLAKVFNTIHRAIADLEIQVGSIPGGAFGPGAVYDMLRALRDLLASAKTDVFVIDPYMDAEVFDGYISAIGRSVATRLLLTKFANSVKPAMAAYLKQYAVRLESRSSPRLHDRVVFIDKRSCYVLGQSIKDAARTRATYLAPLPAEIASLKLGIYEELWSTSTPL
jgi:hypothetical protein